MRSSPRARQAKSRARLTRYEEMAAEAASREKLDFEEIQIPPGPRLGSLVVEAAGLSKGFDDRMLIENLSFSLPPNGIVGVIGPNGIGNGLDAETWAALIDADASELILLLDALRAAGIPAYAARLDRLGRRAPASAFRIWVDTWTYSRAEDVIRETLLRNRRAGR